VVSSRASEVTSVSAKDDADNICRDVIPDAMCTKQRLPGGTPKRDANRGLSAFQKICSRRRNKTYNSDILSWCKGTTVRKIIFIMVGST
jgi:hypothetical protein